MIIEKAVLLLKSRTSGSSPDKYKQLLDIEGFKVSEVKTLVFEFRNIDILREKLDNDTQYEGIIFSSPRCVQSVHLAKTDKEQLKSWKSKHNFAVGEATSKEALNKLGLECEGKESGNALNLSKVILENRTCYSKPFLFPHGNLKTDTLRDELGKNGLGMEDVLVYDTIANPDIEKEIQEVTNNYNDLPQYLVFFSPSGFHSSIDYLKRVPDFPKAKLIAIGPVTEAAIKEGGCDVFGVTKNPTPQDLVNLFSNLFHYK
nr:uroporphyrinogen-III synthase-like [Leptinotarsa decemlineata]